MPSPEAETPVPAVRAPRHSVVVPVSARPEGLEQLLSGLDELSFGLPGGLEVVFVVDGSREAAAPLHQLGARAGVPMRVISHTRPFGTAAAIRTGLAAAGGELIGVMPADLPEPQRPMAKCFTALENGADVAIGRREPTGPATGSRSPRRPGSATADLEMFAVTRAVAACLVAQTEADGGLAEQISWMGYEPVEITYAPPPRPVADTAAGSADDDPVRRLVSTDAPVRALLASGLGLAALTVAASLVVLVGWASGHLAVPQAVPVVLVALLCTATLLCGLGVVGAYAWRLLENGRSRPSSVVASDITYHPGSTDAP